MKKTTMFGILAALSGGVTGLIVCLSIFGISKQPAVTAAEIAVITGFSVLSVLLLMMLSGFFCRFFRSNPENELIANGWIFAIPAISIFVLPVYFKYYSRLSALAPSVFGNIYIPFQGYLHVDMARFFLISAAGAAWLAVVFVLAIRFIIKLYLSSGDFSEGKTAGNIFWFAFFFYVLTTSYVTFVYPPTGDEPHYLVTASSIASDLDFNLENNYTQAADYGRFLPVKLDYRGLHTVAGTNGKGVYTTHDIGLPLIIAPFVKIGGRYPVQIFMNFIAAVLCVMLYLLFLRLGIAMKYSAAAAMAACVCMPLAAGASLVLTEIPAALLVAYSIYVLSGTGAGKRNLLFFLALAFMPWLHLKLIIFPAVFYVYYYYLVLKNRKFNFKTELMNNLPVLVSAVLYLWFYYAVYGIIAPFGVKELHENIYAADPITQENKFEISPVHFIISGMAALFDRDYGLIPYCMFFILSLWGIMMAAWKKQFHILAPLLLCFPYLFLFLLWKDWTGSMTPARQLIPIVPVLIFYGIHFLNSTSFIKTRLFRAMAVFSFFVSWLLTTVPPLRYAASKDKIYAFFSIHAPRWLLWIFPPFRDSIMAGAIISAIYIMAIAALYFHYIPGKIKSQ